MAGTATAPMRTNFSMLVPLVDPDADGGVLVVDAHDIPAPALQLREGGAHVELLTGTGEERVHHVDRRLHAHGAPPPGLAHADEHHAAGPGHVDGLVVVLDAHELGVAGGLELRPGA